MKPMIINQYQIKTKGEDKMKEKQGYKIVDIKWDTDGDKALFDSLPQEIILPEQFCTEDKDDYDYLDEVSEWLSDEYGYCQSGFRIQKTVSLKEWLMMQFNYCNAIASDISEHNKSKEIQEYTKQFAEIESPLVGGTDEKWIRINWGDIYMVKYHFCEMQEKTLPLSESAYVSYDGHNKDYQMHMKGQRKKMTKIEKKIYQETISLIDKFENR